MMEYIDISILNPAEYNPRLLTNEAQEDLKKSIKELGIIKPVSYTHLTLPTILRV